MISRNLVRAMSAASQDRGAAVYTSILKTLTDGLQPTQIELIDDSKSHQGTVQLLLPKVAGTR
jgi:stress-induced morphogen